MIQKKKKKSQVALTLSRHGGGSGVEVREVACHALAGEVVVLWNQDDPEEVVEGVRAYRQTEQQHKKLFFMHILWGKLTQNLM